jgi:hypothetical protein
MTDHTTELEDLGYAAVSRHHLNSLVAASLHRDEVEILEVWAHPVDYASFSIATGALVRVQGTARSLEGDPEPFRIFVKQLQSARAWPLLHIIPEAHRETWTTSFPWRIEIDAFTSPLARALPDAMRLPELYEIVEIDDDRAAIWMEDVDADPAPWSLDRYRRAAYQLGRLAGRRPLGTDTALGPADEHRGPGVAIRMYAAGRLLNGAVPLLDVDDLWQHPSLVAALDTTGEAATLRGDLLNCVPYLDSWLTAMDQLPQTYAHGDASPQNLLIPRERPERFVVIDWGFNSALCVGFDLGQLLLGHVNSGDTPPSMLAAIHEVIEPAYCDGLASTGFVSTRDDVHRGYLMSLAARSLFTTLPLEELDAPDTPELRARLRTRIAMTRFLLNLATELK